MSGGMEAVRGRSLQLPGPFGRHFEANPFQPPTWLKSRHAQTIVAARWPRFLPRHWPHGEEVTFQLQDGAMLKATLIRESSSAPLLVLVHGMGGSSRSAYMRSLSYKAARRGWSSLLLNLYNANPQLERPRIFHAGVSSELSQVLTSLRDQGVSRGILCLGVSMGGNILLKMLGELGEEGTELVQAAVAISPLVDLAASWAIIEKPSNVVYRRYFVRHLVQLVRRHNQHLLSLVEERRLASVRSIRDFDEVVTAPLGGFRDAFDYYRRSSAAPHLAAIRVPTLILHAKDDPLLPWQPLAPPRLAPNPSLLVKLTERGGHVGFLQRRRPDEDRFWAENRALQFLDWSLSRQGWGSAFPEAGESG